MICEFYFWNVGCRYILWEGDMLKSKLWILTLRGTLQQFQHGVLENLSRRVQGVNGEAQQLIQSAAPGVDTDTLETDQESLMDKWNTLNAKVKEAISLTFIYLSVGGHCVVTGMKKTNDHDAEPTKSNTIYFNLTFIILIYHLSQIDK